MVVHDHSCCGIVHVRCRCDYPRTQPKCCVPSLNRPRPGYRIVARDEFRRLVGHTADASTGPEAAEHEEDIF